MAEPTLLTEEEMVALVQAQAAEKGIRGLSRELKVNPGFIQRIVVGKKGAGKSVPAAMGFEVRYVRVDR